MTPDMLDFLRALHQEGARFLVIGGYALAFFGRPRFTKDLDLWVDAEEAPRVLAAIRRFFGGMTWASPWRTWQAPAWSSWATPPTA
nr:nucleotidyl transferase AbiEii/AbiGii toxin family protein [Thermus parvatiensis]